jgi:hypothetical protein
MYIKLYTVLLNEYAASPATWMGREKVISLSDCKYNAIIAAANR